jgi:hypothetical protein
MKSCCLLIRSLLVLTLLCLSGQIVPALAAGDKDWKPIDPAQLSLKEPAVEKDADAEALFWEVRVDDSDEGSLVFSNYLRIKIFTERGKESQSKIDIPFGKIRGINVKVKEIAARTIKPDGTILELNEKDIFEKTDIKASGIKTKVKSFAMPGIEPGAIIEYRWKESYSNASANYLRLEFQRDIPVQLVKYYIKPFASYYRADGLRFQTFNGVNTTPVKEKNGFYSTTMTNMPAYREEPRMPPTDESRTWMLLYYTPEILTKIPTEVYWGAWGIIVEEIHRPDLKANDEVKRATAEAVGDATAPEEKLKRIDKFVRARIKNIFDDAAGLSPEDRAKIKTNKSPSDTLKRGQGTAEDINMLFGAMAIAAGFDAHIAELADRSRVFFSRSVPTNYFLNQHAIAIKVNGDWRFFDPASAYEPYGMMSWKIEGEDALILDKKEPVFVRTPLSAPEKSVEKRTATLKLSEDGTLEGEVRIEYYGHLGADQKEINDENSQQEREEILRNMIKTRLSNAEISNIRIENVTDPEKPFTYLFNIKVPDYAQRTGKRLFIQPAFFQKGVAPLFQTSQRRYQVYFNYPWSEEDTVSIELPAGYALDNADAPAPFKASGIMGYEAKLQVTTDRRTLYLRRKFFFGGGDNILFPVNSYSQLKQVFDVLHERDNHTIALKQGASASIEKQ